MGLPVEAYTGSTCTPSANRTDCPLNHPDRLIYPPGCICRRGGACKIAVNRVLNGYLAAKQSSAWQCAGKQPPARHGRFPAMFGFCGFERYADRADRAITFTWSLRTSEGVTYFRSALSLKLVTWRSAPFFKPAAHHHETGSRPVQNQSPPVTIALCPVAVTAIVIDTGI